MKISELVEALGLEVKASGDMEGEISGVVVGDLLSFIMAKGQPGFAWITIQSHVNVAAVAVLRDMPLIVVASGRPVDDDLVARCSQERVTLAYSSMSAYTLSGKMYGLGLTEVS